MGGFNLVTSILDLPDPGPHPIELFVDRRDGKRIHALDWEGDGPCALFLHGGALSAHTWDLLCSLLRKRYRCVAMDLRGHGDSDWADDYTIPTHVDDVSCLLDHLGWRRFHLVGMSLGGVVSAYTSLHEGAGKIASLTLVDVAPGVLFEKTERVREFIGSEIIRGGVRDLILYARSLGARGTDEQLFHRYAHLVRQKPDGDWCWKYDDRIQMDFDHVLGRIDALNQLCHSFAWPCLVARGGKSKILPEAAASNFASLCPRGSMRTIANAGHTVQEDNPRGLAEALEEFWTAGAMRET
jgi:pimeloyl-ACP methyl ester carboxylesterase